MGPIQYCESIPHHVLLSLQDRHDSPAKANASKAQHYFILQSIPPSNAWHSSYMHNKSQASSS